MGPTRIIRAPRDRDAPPRRRPAPTGTRVLRASHLEALADAERVRSLAEREAREIRERAMGDAAEIRRRAAEESRAEAAALLVRAREHTGATLERAGEQLTRLAVAIAEKLLGEALRLDPARVEQIVAGCVQRVGAQGGRRIVLRVSPEDLAIVERALPRLGRLVEADQLQVQPDPAVGPGGCLVDSELGQLDGRLETQLQAILQALETDR